MENELRELYSQLTAARNVSADGSEFWFYSDLSGLFPTHEYEYDLYDFYMPKEFRCDTTGLPYPFTKKEAAKWSHDEFDIAEMDVEDSYVFNAKDWWKIGKDLIFEKFYFKPFMKNKEYQEESLKNIMKFNFNFKGTGLRDKFEIFAKHAEYSFGETANARLSRYACWSLFRDGGLDCDIMNDSYKRSFFTRTYFMHPETEFVDLCGFYAKYMRVIMRASHRSMEKNFNGMLHNKNINFKSARDIQYKSLFGGAVSLPKTPANFFNANLLEKTAGALSGILRECNEMKARDVPSLIEDKFEFLRINIKASGQLPEEMLCETSVKDTQKMCRKNQNEFVKFYKDRGLVK